jgi:hypothetical protein
MGDKVKGWHSRKPKKHGQYSEKKNRPLRPDQDKRNPSKDSRGDYRNGRYVQWDSDEREYDFGD